MTIRRSHKLIITIVVSVVLGIMVIWGITLALFRKCYYDYSQPGETIDRIIFRGKCERGDKYSTIRLWVYYPTNNYGYFVFQNDTLKIEECTIAKVPLFYQIDTSGISRKEYVFNTTVSFDSLMNYPFVVSFRNKNSTKVFVDSVSLEKRCYMHYAMH